MNIDDKDFIKSVIRDDLSIIPSPGFTADTVLKIKESRNTNPIYQVDSSLIYPVVLYSIIVLLTSILRVFSLLILHDNISFLKRILIETSELLYNPVTISICISVIILYLLDSHLNRLKTKYS